MIYPNDNTQMRQVKIQSHYGQPIILEQCSQCGGIWFDESELFRAKQGESDKIELLDTEILRAPANIEGLARNCPRDKAQLFQFKDRYFPKGIILERCPSCKGVWLNRGAFTRLVRNLLAPKKRVLKIKYWRKKLNEYWQCIRLAILLAR